MSEGEIKYNLKIGYLQFYCSNCGTLQECFINDKKIGKTTCPKCNCDAAVFLGRRYTEIKLFPVRN